MKPENTIKEWNQRMKTKNENKECKQGMKTDVIVFSDINIVLTSNLLVPTLMKLIGMVCFDLL